MFVRTIPIFILKQELEVLGSHCHVTGHQAIDGLLL